MKLVYYHPIAISNKHSFQKVVNPLISVMDRTRRIWPEYNYTNLFPMPTVDAICPDFIQTSIDRVNSIVAQHKKIAILWSGGIDSTFILTLMIEMRVLDKLYQEDRLIIGLNQESIREYPDFYEQHLKSNYLKSLVQSDYVLQNPNIADTIVTGEMADNLVGSLTMKNCVDYYNDFSVVHKPYNIAMDWMARKLDSSEKSLLHSFLEETISLAPVELLTSHDLLWYLNFNFKWQAVNFRIVSHTQTNEQGNALIAKLTHFFNTVEFQQWSMQVGHYFEGSSWTEYKLPLKKQIFKVTGDKLYYDKKTKYPSLPGLLRFKDTFDFIYFDELTGEYKFTKQKID